MEISKEELERIKKSKEELERIKKSEEDFLKIEENSNIEYLFVCLSSVIFFIGLIVVYYIEDLNKIIFK